MSTNEMLKRAISYEESLLRNYRQYEIQSRDTEIGDLFSKLIEEKIAQIALIKSVYKKFCKT